MTEPEYEYGVELRLPNGYVCTSPYPSERGARRIAGIQRDWNPAAQIRIVRRPVAAWSPVPPEGKQATE